MKTLVKAKHPGQKVNGVDGCYTRWGNDGWCDGKKKAEWLNSLGEDEETYCEWGDRIITNGRVRQNWLDHNAYDHLVPVIDPIYGKCPTCNGTGVAIVG